MIDRDSPVPVYYQIQQDLISRISRGEWQIGEQMPSESSLIDEYKVSRVTLRQALAELEKDNLIKRHRGKGAFITGISPKPFVYNLNYKMVSGDGVKNSDEGISAKLIDLKYVLPRKMDFLMEGFCSLRAELFEGRTLRAMLLEQSS